jgi:hypothetical protein
MLSSALSDEIGRGVAAGSWASTEVLTLISESARNTT